MASKQKRTGRSPSYPDIDLANAIDKTYKLWREEGRNFAPVAAIHSHWGFNANTGPALRAVAALGKFGLLEYEGRADSRQAKLTDLALSIVLDEREHSTERLAAIQKAALSPPIHSILWEKYQGNLPSDETLRFFLQKDYKFLTKATSALIAEFRSTIGFAKLQDADNITPINGEQSDDTSNDDGVQKETFADSPRPFEEAPVTETPQAEKMRVLHIPLGDTRVDLRVPQPMSQSQWDLMRTVLDAMEPGIVSESNNDGPGHVEPSNVGQESD